MEKTLQSENEPTRLIQVNIPEHLAVRLDMTVAKYRTSRVAVITDLVATLPALETEAPR